MEGLEILEIAGAAELFDAVEEGLVLCGWAAAEREINENLLAKRKEMTDAENEGFTEKCACVMSKSKTLLTLRGKVANVQARRREALVRVFAVVLE